MKVPQHYEFINENSKWRVNVEWNEFQVYNLLVLLRKKSAIEKTHKEKYWFANKWDNPTVYFTSIFK